MVMDANADEVYYTVIIINATDRNSALELRGKKKETSVSQLCEYLLKHGYFIMSLKILYVMYKYNINLM